jgi:hypothetical protein
LIVDGGVMLMNAHAGRPNASEDATCFVPTTSSGPYCIWDLNSQFFEFDWFLIIGIWFFLLFCSPAPLSVRDVVY